MSAPLPVLTDEAAVHGPSMGVPEGDRLVVDSRAVLSRHARSFRWAGALLPRARLDDAAMIYALCRLIDDLADESPDPSIARRDLDRLRAELTGVAPARDLVRASREVLERSPVGVEPALHLIDGVLADLDEVCFQTDRELHRYAYRVAGTVGLMMCAVLGVSDPRALPHAVDLGVAMQLTNICRDVLEDAGRDRVYLPAERLRIAGVSPQRLCLAARVGPDLTPDERDAVAAVVHDLLTEADRYYASAAHGMRFIPVRARLAIQVASRVYRAIGVRLRRRGSDAWAGRTVIGVPGKLAWTLLAVGRWLGAPLRRRAHDPALHAHLGDLPGCHEKT